MSTTHHMASLSMIDIDNLAAGRITRDALHVAAQRVAKRLSQMDLDVGSVFMRFSTHVEMCLADEINDMLQDAREAVNGEGNAQ